MAKNSINYIVAACVVFVIALANSLYIVDERESAIVLQFGDPIATVRQPGLKFRVPFIQNVLFFDNRIQSVSFTPEGRNVEVMSFDQKTMKLDAYAKYRIVEPLQFYKSVQDEERFRTRIVPVLESSIREIVGTTLFVDVLGSKRSGIADRIMESVKKQAQAYGIEIVDLRIIRVNVPDKARDAVYRRMITDREIEAKEIRAQGSEGAQTIIAVADRDRAKMLADATGAAEVIKGEGEAESAKMVASGAAQDPEFYAFYRTLQAYKTAFSKDSTNMVLSTGGEFLRYISPK